MRVLGSAQAGRWRRMVLWLLVFLLLGAGGAMAAWARQQETARRTAEFRAETAESRLVAAEASLTALVRSSAAATPTAAAQANQPEAALKRALDLVFEAYRDPSEARLRALSAAFSPEALNFERAEAEHLISAGTHLAGGFPYEMQVLSTESSGPDTVQIRTRETWTYDEVDAQNRRSRCVREESEQSYTMKRVPGGWLVDDIQLSGAARRTDC
ncbi:MAG: hypothetical protein M3336_07880 [Chloroflexota bacterium]|nr:hypothetical protein [Chloroflexota bacterium]